MFHLKMFWCVTSVSHSCNWEICCLMKSVDKHPFRYKTKFHSKMLSLIRGWCIRRRRQQAPLTCLSIRHTTPHHMLHISVESNFRDVSYSCDLIVLGSVTYSLRIWCIIPYSSLPNVCKELYVMKATWTKKRLWIAISLVECTCRWICRVSDQI